MIKGQYVKLMLLVQASLTITSTIGLELGKLAERVKGSRRTVQNISPANKGRGEKSNAACLRQLDGDQQDLLGAGKAGC